LGRARLCFFAGFFGVMLEYEMGDTVRAPSNADLKRRIASAFE
jgi:hypothetical protein